MKEIKETIKELEFLIESFGDEMYKDEMLSVLMELEIDIWRLTDGETIE